MTTSNGASLPSRSSRATDPTSPSPTSPSPTTLWADLGVFVVVGVAAAVIDLYMRAPLHMPGWRGLFTMGFFIAARQFSARAWAASAAAGVTALASVALAGPPQFSTLAFLVPGLAIDLVYGLGSRFREKAAFAGFAAGLANMAKLAVTFLFAAAVTQRNETAGMILPWVSHFALGCAGGVLAALAVRWSEPKA